MPPRTRRTKPLLSLTKLMGGDAHFTEAEPVATVSGEKKIVAQSDSTSESHAVSSSKHGFGGWVRVDSDHVMRGWATDRSDRAVRPRVDIFIDDEPVASLLADRLDPKLIELGEGDGLYAFALVIPEQYRDGQSHVFAVRVRGVDYRLKSKAETFEIDQGAWVPWIEIYAVGFGTARGRLHNSQFSRSVGLELWRDSHRLDAGVGTEWYGPHDEPDFIVAFPPELLEGGELVLAVPGMMEAGLVCPLLSVDTRLEATHDETGELNLLLSGDLSWLESRAVQLSVYKEGGDEPSFIHPLNEIEPATRVMLPSDLARASLTVALSIDGFEPSQLSGLSRRTLGQLTRNGAFQSWSKEGPDGWTAGSPQIALDRGYYAFPDRIIEQQGASGDYLHADIAAGDAEPVVVVRQVLDGTALNAGDFVEGALLVRTSAPAEIRLAVRNEAGVVLGSFSVKTRRPWAWAYGAERVSFDTGAASCVAEVIVIGPPEIEVDIAGVRLGGQHFWETADETAPQYGETVNAIENHDLRDWPNGVVMSCAGRTETARGWFVVNRRSQEPILVKALFEDEESPSIGYAFAAAKVQDYCRLEVRMDAAILSAMSAGNLSFAAGSPSAARRLLGASTVPTPEFHLIDKIMVLKRTQVQTAQGFSLSDETVATPGRKLLVTRSFHEFSLPLTLASAAKPSDFDWEETGAPAEGVSDYYLVFEIRQTFALALRNLRVSHGPPSVPELQDGYLQLEDRSIASQIDHTKGLAHWLSPEPISPDYMVSGQRPADGLKWSWSALSLGTVEVVICVYNAVEETLACLQSLIGSTEIPHTVRIIDDGSEPQVTRRLESFIADKPWMRLQINPQNMGYTPSADQGIRDSEADWVILLNSDTIVTPGWIEGLLEVTVADPHVAFVGPLSNAATFQSVPDLYDANNKFKTNELPIGWTPARMAALVASHSEKDFPEAPLLNGFCTLIRRSVFLEVGGLNRGAFPAGYGEENDLCTRVVKAGYKLAIADHVYVFHSKSASFGSARRTELAKAGSKALKELHPDVDYGALTVGFRDIPALVRLRANLREVFEKLV